MEPLEGRSCGECSLCCKLLDVPQISKPKGVWCQHHVPGTGCGIHATRFDICRSFFCHWMINPNMGPEWKPSVCGMLVGEKDNQLIVHVDEGSPGPWREPYLTWLRRMSAAALPHGGMVLVVDKGRIAVVLPDRAVDVGVLADDDRIVLAEVMVEGRRNWEVSLRKKDDAEKFVAQVTQSVQATKAARDFS